MTKKKIVGLVPGANFGVGQYLKQRLTLDHGVTDEQIQFFCSEIHEVELDHFEEAIAKETPESAIAIVSQSILERGTRTNKIARELFERGFTVVRIFEMHDEPDFSCKWALKFDSTVSVFKMAEQIARLR